MVSHFLLNWDDREDMILESDTRASRTMKSLMERLQMYLKGRLMPLPSAPVSFILKVNRERTFENIAFP